MIAAAVSPPATCASSTSRPWAREIDPAATASTIAASSTGATSTGPAVAFRRRRYSPVTQFATGFGPAPGAAARVASNSAGRGRIRHEHPRVVGRQPELVPVPRPPGRRQLRQACPDPSEPGRVEVEWRQVGLREVAVIVGGLLDPHPVGLAAVVRPAAGLLDERLAGVEGGGLAVDLEGDRPLDGPERVHVLDLDPRPERLGPDRLAATRSPRLASGRVPCRRPTRRSTGAAAGAPRHSGAPARRSGCRAR